MKSKYAYFVKCLICQIIGKSLDDDVIHDVGGKPMSVMVKVIELFGKRSATLKFTLNVNQFPNIGKLSILPSITECPTDPELRFSLFDLYNVILIKSSSRRSCFDQNKCIVRTTWNKMQIYTSPSGI